jgi:hypothetical protein
MKPRGLLATLIGLNVGLVGIIAYLSYLLVRRELLPISPEAARALAAENRANGPRTNLKVVSLPRILPLDWRSIESTNYTTYIANLRAIGCPAETIRDIIRADIDNEFSQRRARLRGPAREPRYWVPDPPDEESLDPSKWKQLRALELERRELLKQLLGTESDVESLQAPSFQRVYGFLSQSKQRAILDLQAKYEEREAQVVQAALNFMTPDDEEALEELRRAQQAEIDELLTPEEHEQYELRNSETAQQLRAGFVGFEPTEEEFKQLYRLRKAFNEQFGDQEAEQPTGVDPAREEARRTLEEETKKILGEDRFAQFQNAQDGDYQDLRRLGERFEVPDDSLRKVYEMKKTVQNQAIKLQLNLKLSDEQRERALSAMKQETEKALLAALGREAYRAYRQVVGQWLDEYSTPLDISALREEAQSGR